MNGSATNVVRTFTDAVNRRDHDAAAKLLARSAEVVGPGGTLVGRDAWLDSRRQQPPPRDLTEEVAVDELAESDDGVELRGRLVQRWTESGEVADEMPVRISFTLEGGSISRLEMRPGASTSDD